MRLKVLDTILISSVSKDALLAGAEISVSQQLGEELMKKNPRNFLDLDGTKSEGDAPNNKALPGAEENKGYDTKTVAELKALAAEREVDLGDATRKADIIAALELADDAAKTQE